MSLSNALAVMRVCVDGIPQLGIIVYKIQNLPATVAFDVET